MITWQMRQRGNFAESKLIERGSRYDMADALGSNCKVVYIKRMLDSFTLFLLF
jgi:hypothetical protein